MQFLMIFTKQKGAYRFRGKSQLHNRQHSIADYLNRVIDNVVNDFIKSKNDIQIQEQNKNQEQKPSIFIEILLNKSKDFILKISGIY